MTSRQHRKLSIGKLVSKYHCTASSPSGGSVSMMCTARELHRFEGLDGGWQHEPAIADLAARPSACCAPGALSCRLAFGQALDRNVGNPAGIALAHGFANSFSSVPSRQRSCFARTRISTRLVRLWVSKSSKKSASLSMTDIRRVLTVNSRDAPDVLETIEPALSFARESSAFFGVGASKPQRASERQAFDSPQGSSADAAPKSSQRSGSCR